MRVHNGLMLRIACLHQCCAVPACVIYTCGGVLSCVIKSAGSLPDHGEAHQLCIEYFDSVASQQKYTEMVR